MSTARNKRPFWIAVLIPVVVLAAMTVLPLATILWGEEIVLETRPVDPRDLFRGDYVMLAYTIDEVPLAKLPPELQRRLLQQYYYHSEHKESRRNLYVVLRRNGPYHEVDHVSLTRPKNAVYLTARLRYFHSIDEQSTAFLDYGLDRFFVPENTGLELERASQQGALAATVKVFRGYGVLRNLELK